MAKVTTTKKSNLSPAVVHESDIVELMGISESFAPLKNMSIPEDDEICWDMNGKDAYCIQTMFIGKTGYGKSTSLNTICGQELFKTDDISSCTKEIFSSEYKIHNKKNYYVSFCDLPGLGESTKADKKYVQWYAEMLLKSYCLVYVLRADQRDYSIDEEIIRPLLHDPSQRKKMIIAINFADKAEPLSRKLLSTPTKEQLQNINEKKQTIKRLFNIPLKNIVCYSAKTGYNIDSLKQKMADTLIFMVKQNKKPKKSTVPFKEKCKAIYDLTPQDSCGECGAKNCYQFAMMVASGKWDIHDCEYIEVDDEEEVGKEEIEKTFSQEEFRYAQALYSEELYEKALPLLQRYAASGNAEAQFYLGTCYDFGRGVPQDEVKATQWYKKAAKQGINVNRREGSSYRFGGIGTSDANWRIINQWEQGKNQGSFIFKWSF